MVIEKILSWLSSRDNSPSCRSTPKFLKLLPLCSFKMQGDSAQNSKPKALQLAGELGFHCMYASNVKEFKNNHLKRNSPLMSLVQKCAQIVLALKSKTLK